ncbi:4-carboxymuconolactone decarboxylase [Abditibacterium utsteinense]|uniref:4-carboxymuconolactone decarboxylase n=1 Tax=Abditibacterium utsteinense TaxID=1960156 RepID=A0A2S8SPE0_9BACT|nr:carboxymuconolactone decarboxylase family protein [Abditibacterium utsteinense]PQV62660.1 4-carboxymuconolactone decarboxylase [Abditibacterium utsteinense]
MSRIRELKREELDASARQTYDEIFAARGSMAGPFGVWMHSPKFTRRATQLGEFLRYHTSLAPRLSELVILITARCQKSEVEWDIHEPLARKAGLAEEIVESLRTDTPPNFSNLEEQATYDFCTQLHQTQRVDKVTFQQLIEVLGEKAAVEMVGLCGYYTMVAMTLNAFHIGVDEERRDE